MNVTDIARRQPGYRVHRARVSGWCVLGVFVFFAKGLLAELAPGVETGDWMDVPRAMTAGSGDLFEEDRRLFALERARRSVEYGLSGIAQRALEQLRDSDDGSNPSFSEEVRILLMTALIQRGFYEQADRVFGTLEQPLVPSAQLRKAVIEFGMGNRETLRDRLSLLDGSMLNSYERSWLHIVRGSLALSEMRVAEARGLYELAVASAVNPLHESQIQVVVWGQEIRYGEASEALALNLKNQIAEALNPVVAAQLAQQYAVVLVGLGRGGEAIELVERQIAIQGPDARDQRDRLLLMLSLLAGRDSGKSQLALENLLTQGRNERLRMMALGQWLTLWSPESEERGISFLKELVEQRTDDPLRDYALYALASVSLRRGSFNEARDLANRIADITGDIGMKESALRLLAASSLMRANPQFRLAAEWLIRLQDAITDPSEIRRIGRMIGDCYLAIRDYGNALACYLGSMETEQDADHLDYLRSRAVECHLRMGSINQGIALLESVSLKDGGMTRWVWHAEWNVSIALVQARRRDDAISRVSRILETLESSGENDEWDGEARMRASWLLGYLHYQGGDYENGLSVAQGALSRHEALSSVEGIQIRGELKLLEIRCLLAMDYGEEAFASLALLREDGELEADSVASTFLLEARHLRSRGRVVDAQGALISLADRYPLSRYAPVALYEAAIHAETRGTSGGDEEAIRLLQRIVRDFPAHPLNFVAQLRQGDVLRRSNQFALAAQLYESMLRERSGDPRIVMVEMALGECYFALGTSRDSYTDDAIRLFERLFDLRNLSLEVRLEAGTKAAIALQKVGRSARAQDFLWRVIQEVLDNSVDASDSMGSTGRYWLARAMLVLSEQLAAEGEDSQVSRIKGWMKELGLPGYELMQSTL